jgi:hypothetical protein
MITKYNESFWNVLSDVYPFFTTNITLPDGYVLTETDAHKKQRLEDSIADKKSSLSAYEKRISELSKQISEEESELLQISQNAK